MRPFPLLALAPCLAGAAWSLSMLCVPTGVGPTTVDPLEQRTETLLERLSTEEKIGQMLFLGIEGTEVDGHLASFLRAKRPGGVALYRRNIQTDRQTARLIRGLREHDPSGVPMFIAVDEEGGPVVRFRHRANIIPSNMALGATFDPALARRAGLALGRELRDLGFNMNFAPVVDVHSNPRSVIGIRSFGESPWHVAAMAVAFIEGQQAEGVSAVAKHFPGHGATDADSHSQLPTVPHDEARFSEALVPFQAAAAAKVDALMTAHVAFPGLAEQDVPATLSHEVVTRLLRERLGFEGVVVTDGLEMAGIVSRCETAEAAVRAAQAGADMMMVLWKPETQEAAHRALEQAVRTGRITSSRLDESVRRILRAKVRRGLFDRAAGEQRPSFRAPEGAPHPIAAEIARRAVTLVRNDGVLPLPADDVLVVASTKRDFLGRLLEVHERATPVALSSRAIQVRPRLHADRLLELSSGASTLVVAVHRDEHRGLLERLNARRRGSLRVVVVSLGSPYLLLSFPEAEACICTYGYRAPSGQVAVDVLFGRREPAGRLPVRLDAHHPLGHGLGFKGPSPNRGRADEPRAGRGCGFSGRPSGPPGAPAARARGRGRRRRHRW